MEIIIRGHSKSKLLHAPRFMKWIHSFDKNVMKDVAVEERWSLWRGKKKDELVFALFCLTYVDELGKDKRKFVFFRNNALTSNDCEITELGEYLPSSGKYRRKLKKR